MTPQISDPWKTGPAEREEKDPASDLLGELEESTLQRAWGDRGPEERRWIVVAATIFGRQFERHISSHQTSLDEQESQRLLMAVIRASIDEFAESENLPQDEAAEFLGEVETRDLVLEFNEVLEAYNPKDPDKSLDELLKEAVDSRLDKARWADHWSSG